MPDGAAILSGVLQDPLLYGDLCSPSSWVAYYGPVASYVPAGFSPPLRIVQNGTSTPYGEFQPGAFLASTVAASNFISRASMPQVSVLSTGDALNYNTISAMYDGLGLFTSAIGCAAVVTGAVVQVDSTYRTRTHSFPNAGQGDYSTVLSNWETNKSSWATVVNETGTLLFDRAATRIKPRTYSVDGNTRTWHTGADYVASELYMDNTPSDSTLVMSASGSARCVSASSAASGYFLLRFQTVAKETVSGATDETPAAPSTNYYAVTFSANAAKGQGGAWTATYNVLNHIKTFAGAKIGWVRSAHAPSIDHWPTGTVVPGQDVPENFAMRERTLTIYVELYAYFKVDNLTFRAKVL